jgi:hypothetical protein
LARVRIFMPSRWLFLLCRAPCHNWRRHLSRCPIPY